MTFAEQLKAMGACASARDWVGARDLPTAWAECQEPSWMFWLAGRTVSRQALVLAACDCAELALKYVPAGEDRPRIAIETARKWARGEATIEQVHEARRNAYDAAADADAADDAAYDAARGAATYAAAAACASAADAADDAATAATAANAARKTSNLESCNAIRRNITADMIAAGMKEWDLP
jgi:hypothetical protein